MKRWLMDVKVSVIVPVYNTEKYLKRCIDSILCQTLVEIEIIIVDDGSTDRSASICDEYSCIDKRVIVIHKSNEGVSAARNDALDVAKGEYIGFVDSDDIISPHMYKTLYTNAIKYGGDISACGMLERFDGNIDIEAINGEFALFNNAKDAIAKVLIPGSKLTNSCCNKIIYRDLIKGRRFEKCVAGEDVDFLMSCFFDCRKVVYDNRVGYWYIHHSASASIGEFDVRKMSIINVVDNVYDEVMKRYPDLENAARAYKLMWYIATIRRIHKSANRKSYLSEYDNLVAHLKSEKSSYLYNYLSPLADRLLCFGAIYGMFGLINSLIKTYKTIKNNESWRW